jgi:hypothetical protein
MFLWWVFLHSSLWWQHDDSPQDLLEIMSMSALTMQCFVRIISMILCLG